LFFCRQTFSVRFIESLPSLPSLRGLPSLPSLRGLPDSVASADSATLQTTCSSSSPDALRRKPDPLCAVSAICPCPDTPTPLRKRISRRRVSLRHPASDALRENERRTIRLAPTHR